MPKLNFRSLGLQKSKLILLVFAFSFLFVSTAYAAPDTDKMLGYWKFDGSCDDSSGDECTCTLSGASFNTHHGATVFSNTKSINLNGGSASFANQSNLNPSGDFSLSFWINLNSAASTNTFILGNYAAANPYYGFNITAQPYRLSFFVGNGGSPSDANSATGLVASTWYHIAATYNSGSRTMRLYVNGLLVDTQTTSFTNIAYTASQFGIGQFDGRIDDLRLYGRTLSASEIQDLHNGNHTTATWIGTISTDYENDDNWNNSAIPDPYTKIIISATSNQPTFTQSESIAGLQINSGASLDLKDYGLTMNDTGSFSNNGSLSLENYNQTISGLTNDTDSGTIILKNTNALSSFKLGSSYNHLTLDGTGAVSLSAALNVNGNLIISSGSFNPGTNQVLIGKDWRNDAVFDAGNSTVIFDGTSQAIFGSNSFYNLTKTTAAEDIIYFQPGTTQTIAHALTLKSSSTSNLLKLRSITNGSQWSINPQGTRDILNLDVRDSINTNSNQMLGTGLNIINSGNNVNWLFNEDPPTISLDDFDKSTSNERKPVSGTATEYSSTVSNVEFQIDSTSGAWLSCIADDSAFDSSSERFTCTPTDDLSQDEHTYYFRATDSDGYTTVSDYTQVIIDIVSGNSNDDDHHSTSDSSSSTATTSSATQTSQATSTNSWPENSTTPKNESSTATTTYQEESSSPLISSGLEIMEKAESLGTTTTTWQQENFGTSACTDLSICGDQADPDNDGINNAQEYLLGTDPKKADTDGDGISDSQAIQQGENPVTGKQIEYENAKAHGKVEDKVFKVENVQMVSSDEGGKKIKLTGKGLPNSYVTIFIYSDPTVLTVKTDSDGNWSYELDNEIADGEHEVYVGITDSNGKVIAKSSPLPFVKTAEAVTVVSPSQASVVKKNLLYIILLSVAALFVTILIIGFIIKKRSRLSVKQTI